MKYFLAREEKHVKIENDNFYNSCTVAFIKQNKHMYTDCRDKEDL